MNWSTYFIYGCPLFPAPFVEHYLFSTKLPWHHHQKEVVHISVDLFLDSPFCSTDLFIYLTTNITTLPWLLQLYNKCLNQLARYPPLFFFIFLGILVVLVFCISLGILESICQFLQKQCLLGFWLRLPWIYGSAGEK